MHGPRYVMLALPRPDSGKAADELPPDVSWILIASNNRMLGRSPVMFGSLEQVVADIDHLRAHYMRATGATALSGQTHRWAWRLELNGTAIAMCGRLFFRHTECLYNLRRFLDAVPDSPLTEDVRIVHGGRR